MKEQKHPSGLTMAQWRYPFKTEAQRKQIVAWFKKEQRAKHAALPEALV